MYFINTVIYFYTVEMIQIYNKSLINY